jgi:hypothetical protein
VIYHFDIFDILKIEKNERARGDSNSRQTA